MTIAIIALIVCYVIGSIPFGWLIARSRGINIFAAGSGNIGATNVGRVLGRKYGLLVFALDFAKGAVPVAAMRLMPREAHDALTWPHALEVAAAVCAFFGHLFPVWLKFRGGKGVATGLGTVVVLVPGPAMLALLCFIAAVAGSRTISLGSIVAVVVLSAARLLSVADAFDPDHLVVTGFILFGSALLLVKHRTNIRRLLAGTENRLENRPMFGTVARGLHVLSLGMWFGAGVMFNLIVAPTQFFEAFPAAVASAPSDRTAHLELAPGATPKQKEQLASALAGTAVGPVFPKYFRLQAVCAVVALATAAAWFRRGRWHRVRVYVLVIAAVTVAVGWPLSAHVSAVRMERYHPDSATASAAEAAFASWHLVSLGLSFVTIAVVGVALAMAARMPQDHQAA